MAQWRIFIGQIKKTEVIMIGHIRIATTLALICALSVAHAEDLKCQSEQSLSDGGFRTMTVKLSVEFGKLTAVSIASTNASGEKEAFVYWCVLDSVDTKQVQARWSRNGGESILHLTDMQNGDQSRVKIKALVDGYKVDVEKVNHDYCGKGAPLPSSITVERGKNACAVIY
ncbi:MAG: hypothetical protein ABI583_13220 [Betaproteobacteria bacterium]